MVWSIPALTIILLGGVAWIGSHQLDPARPVAGTGRPVNIQVVSLDWKWLFIYPDQRIATVNTLTVPAGAPLHFQLTSASVMNVFFIPQLGSMIYTMNGMVTRLDLQADEVGDLSRPVGAFQRRRLSRHAVRRPRRVAAGVSRAGPPNASSSDRVLNARQLQEQLLKQSVPKDKAGLPARRSRAVPDHRDPEDSAGPGPGAGRPTEAAEHRSGAMFGKLTWAAIPFDQPIPLIAGAVVLVVHPRRAGLGRRQGPPALSLARVDHQRRSQADRRHVHAAGAGDAAARLHRRDHDARAAGGRVPFARAILPPEHYNQIFSAHGTIMIFFVAMPFVIGLMNFVVPLQLGVRDVAFPTLNSVGFWLTATGALLVNISLVVGEFARTGWLPYPPLSELTYSPGVGVDYYLWALQISGVGTLLTGINLVTTMLKIAHPGMTYMRMPMFCWTTLASNLLIVAAFPILTATLAMLMLDRYLGFHFFTNEAGGNVMMFMNLIWAWGHPEVYILVLPAFGIFSEVVSTFSGKPLFGYRSMVLATMAICIISFMVWLHHFFTMGAGADVNAIFGIATMIIAVPHRREDLQLAVHDVWRPRPLHDADAVVDRLHGDLRHRRHDRRAARRAAGRLPAAQQPVPGRAFPQRHHRRRAVRRLRRLHLLVPQGVRLPPARGLGQGRVLVLARSASTSPSCRSTSLGLLGMTRRMQHYDVPEWQPWLLVAGVGAVLILIGIVCQIAQLVVSIRHREELRDATGDPWDGRSLEWATASPPPVFNFAVLPNVERRGGLLGASSSARSEQATLTSEPRLQADRDAAQHRRPASSAPSSPPSWASR